ncbi:MAG: indole-3-glycerol phosphate synthase TrpC [Desulfuromonadaceae bacterium]|nr:indole-3-glycerol phosphate synthase TrpC [Desulfuromonas sp.]MDY0185301.1 indole-3-glycerol phosphate synthase TrpC [Desulfuromonadaceae bacterium]
MILDKILAHKVEEVRKAKDHTSQDELELRCAKRSDCRGFEQRLRQVAHVGTAIIAEVKKGSPSKGLIRADFDPLEIAKGYEEAGAACLSVLTDAEFFLGSLDSLESISRQVTIPLLRKDFIVDPYQIYEARASGADAVLLIAAALEAAQLADYYDLARELGLDVLMEVHNEVELEVVLQTPCTLVGINNRCLKSFVTDIGVTERLIPLITGSRLVVSESGINSRSDIETLQGFGANAFLVGESLMREADYRAKLYELRGVRQ